jgi:hypothetical protein
MEIPACAGMTLRISGAVKTRQVTLCIYAAVQLRQVTLRIYAWRYESLEQCLLNG